MDNYYLRLKCYHCGSIMEAWDHSAGKRSRCPKCDAPIKVPHFKYFEQFNGKKILAGKIDDWNKKDPWKPEDHPVENIENPEPIVYAKETADGLIIENKEETSAVAGSTENPEDNPKITSATIKPTMYDFDDELEPSNDEVDSSAAGSDDAAKENIPETATENLEEKGDLPDIDDAEKVD